MNPLPSDSHCKTDAAERALLALVCAGDRSAMAQLYIRYFARLAKFFQNVTLRDDVVEELINDTMLQVWNASESIRTNAPVLLAILRLAYSRAQRYFAEVKADAPHSQRDDCEQPESKFAKAPPSGLHIFLCSLPVEERTVVHLVYASGCSRRDTADVMAIASDCVDVLLRGVVASATQYYGDTCAQGGRTGVSS
jgi:DNA-directed RNA polymerase specialized sigma24 family protein